MNAGFDSWPVGEVRALPLEQIGERYRRYRLTSPEAEEEMVRTRGLFRSTVLKVPHHGSLTSSSEAFIKEVMPTYAVFTGRLGGFLPHPKIIKRYEQMGVKTIRIDQEGAVSFTTDGSTLKVERLLPIRKETVSP